MKCFSGSLDSGVTYNGKPAHVSPRTSLEGAVILASRSEIKRGEWKRFEKAAVKIRPMGSVAYKLALVSAGLADITFTLTPKHEWDIAAGAALVSSAGGFISTLERRRCGAIASRPAFRVSWLAEFSARSPARSGE